MNGQKKNVDNIFCSDPVHDHDADLSGRLRGHLLPSWDPRRQTAGDPWGAFEIIDLISQLALPISSPKQKIEEGLMKMMAIGWKGSYNENVIIIRFNSYIF